MSVSWRRLCVSLLTLLATANVLPNKATAVEGEVATIEATSTPLGRLLVGRQERRRRHERGTDGSVRPRLLMLYPGPIYHPAELFAGRLEGLSRYFTGSLIAFGPGGGPAGNGEEGSPPVMGAFDVHIIRHSARAPGRMRSMLRKVGEVHELACQDGRPYDLVIAYDPLLTGLTALIAARRIRAKLIVEVNGDYWASSNYWQVGNPLRRGVKRRLYVAVESFVLRRADGIKLLYPTQLYPLGLGAPTQVVHSFSDYVDPEGYPNLGETPEVLLVGFPFHVKGVDVLVEAFRQVADEFPDWHLKILGWYAGAELDRLNEAIAGHSRIHHHPPVSPRVAATHIGRCGILVLPSRTEGMGRVLLEAMAAGKPRIGTRVGGISTVIDHGVDGLLVPPDDPDALADALRRLMGDAGLREAMGRAAARRAHESFSVDSYFRKQRELCFRVLGEGQRRVVSDGQDT